MMSGNERNFVFGTAMHLFRVETFEPWNAAVRILQMNNCTRLTLCTFTCAALERLVNEKKEFLLENSKLQIAFDSLMIRWINEL